VFLCNEFSSFRFSASEVQRIAIVKRTSEIAGKPTENMDDVKIEEQGRRDRVTRRS
jgi:hypothetical protein